MRGTDHLCKVAGYDFHDLRRKYDVRTMWGDLDPQWRLLQSQLVARGPDWYSPAALKERLFTNKSKRPEDDLKETLRTDLRVGDPPRGSTFLPEYPTDDLLLQCR